MRAARLARARVPGHPRHRHERQDVGRADDRGAARGRRALGRFVHQPAPRARQRADGVERRADRRRRARRAARARSRDVEDLLPDAPSYFEILTAAALRLVRRRRRRRRRGRGRAGRHLGRHQRGRRPRSRSSPTSSIDHVEYLGPTREDIAAEKAGIVEPGVDARAGRDRSRAACRSSSHASPARSSSRDVDFGVRDNRLALGGRCSTSSRRRRAYDDVFLAAARRAPGRQRGDRARRGRGVPRRARSTPSSSPTRSRTVQSPGRLEVVGHQPLVLLDGAQNVAGARRVARRARRGVRRLAAHARRRPAAREGAARDARRARRARRRRGSCAAGPPSPRARDPHEVADAADDLGVDRAIDRRDRRRAPTR